MNTRAWGHLRSPSAGEIETYAAALGWSLTRAEVDLFAESVTDALAVIDEVEYLPEVAPALKYQERDPGRRATPEEDPLNAIIQLCEVKGAPAGPLAGRTLGVKDCIAVAGVPMTNGGRRQPVLMPTEDAVVVERLLDAGVTVTAKTNMEDLGYGLGEGSAFGATRNPFDPTRSSGGSSGGSAAAVAAGRIDLGLGADEAGSVRIPAAWCGLVGMKATHGLVPSYGMSYINHTLDHIGPITRSVLDNALMLEAIAGPDWRDPQWARDIPHGAMSYSNAATDDLNGVKIGVLIDALGPVGATRDVIETFRSGVETLAQQGATVSEVSVPLWSKCGMLMLAALPAGAYYMAISNGTGGFGHLGRIDPQTVAVSAAQSKLGGNDYPPLMKSLLLLAAHLNAHYAGLPFVKGHNLRLELRRQIDTVLKDVDVIVTPTTPDIAHVLLAERTDIATMIGGRVGTATANTVPTDLSGHPSLTVPCGTATAGMPAGLQIIGRHYAEHLMYRVGFAMEANRPPQQLRP